MDIENIIGSRSKIIILRALFSSEETKYTIFGISKLAKVPYSVAYRDIRELTAENFVYIAKDGKKNAVFLNKEHEHYSIIQALFSKQPAVQKKTFKSKEALILIHHNADPDAVGSAVALSRGLSQSGIKCEIAAPEGISKQSREVLSKYPYPISETVIRFPELVVVLDTSSREQIGNLTIPESSKIVVIDHHAPGNMSDSADFKLIDTNAHSTGILVYDFLISSGMKITSEIAFFLLVAIVADTAFLRLVNSRDLLVVSKLMEKASLDEVISILSIKTSFSERIANAKALSRADIYRIDERIVVFSSAGSFESGIARSIVNSFADIAVIANIKPNDVRISGRMRSHMAKFMDLAAIFKNIGPLIGGSAGGHATAASANGSNDANIKKVREMLLSEISKNLGSSPKRLS